MTYHIYRESIDSQALDKREVIMRHGEETTTYGWMIEAVCTALERDTKHTANVDLFDLSWLMSFVFPFRDKEEILEDLMDERCSRINENEHPFS